MSDEYAKSVAKGLYPIHPGKFAATVAELTERVEALEAKNEILTRLDRIIELMEKNAPKRWSRE